MFTAITNRINKHLTPTHRCFVEKSGSKYAMKTIENKVVFRDLSENEAHYTLEGMYEGVKLAKPLKK